MAGRPMAGSVWTPGARPSQPGSPASAGSRSQSGCAPVDPCQQQYFDQLNRELPSSDVPPNFYPPIDARILTLGPARAVLNVPAAIDPDANLAGTNLQVAQSAFGAVAIDASGNPFVIFQGPTQQGHVLVVSRWGLTVNVGDPTAAQVTVNIGGPATATNPPSPIISGAAMDLQQPAGFIIPDGKSFTVSVKNLDTHSPMMVTFAGVGWIMPRNYTPDDPRSLLRRAGFGRGKK